MHLLAAMDPPATRCWPNARSPARRGGPAFAPLLADLDLDGVVVTADALQSHPEAAEFLVRDKQATACWWSRPTANPAGALPAPAPGIACHKATAPVTAATVASRSAPSKPSRYATPGFPHAAQVTRKRHHLGTRRWQTVTVDAITSLPFQLAPRPAWPTRCLATGRSRRCTTSATSPSPRTTPNYGPAAHCTSWPPCATWPSGRHARPGRSTSPPRCATTPATHIDPWPPWRSACDETDITPQ